MTRLTARLQPTRPEETDLVLQFYKANPSEFILPRPAQEFDEAVSRRWHFLVRSNGHILAASGIFDYSVDQPFVEASETIILQPIQGFRLQGFLCRLRIAAVVVTQGPNVGITSAVDPNNKRSISNVLRQGFTTWSNPIEDVYASCSTCMNRFKATSNQKKCWCDYYILPIEAARARVRTLIEETSEGQVALTNQHGDELVVDCSDCLVVADQAFREMLQDFAQGNAW